MVSGASLCKTFGTRSGQTKGRACSGFKLFYTLIIFLKYVLEERWFWKKKQPMTKSMKTYTACRELMECVSCAIKSLRGNWLLNFLHKKCDTVACCNSKHNVWTVCAKLHTLLHGGGFPKEIYKIQNKETIFLVHIWLTFHKGPISSQCGLLCDHLKCFFSLSLFVTLHVDCTYFLWFICMLHVGTEDTFCYIACRLHLFL